MIDKTPKGLTAPPFVCEGCGLLIYPKDRRSRKYCNDPKCQLKRQYKNDAASQLRHPVTKTIRVKKDKLPATEKPKPELLRKEPADPKNMEGIDRGAPAGFKRYMKVNPFYFETAFPGQTIEAAWAETMGKGKI